MNGIGAPGATKKNFVSKLQALICLDGVTGAKTMEIKSQICANKIVINCDTFFQLLFEISLAFVQVCSTLLPSPVYSTYASPSTYLYGYTKTRDQRIFIYYTG